MITDGKNYVFDSHPFLNQASEQRLKDAGCLDDSVVGHTSMLVGQCLAAGRNAECYQ